MVTALNNKVLVLNKSWRAISVTTVREALTLVYRDHAQIVDPATYATFDISSWKDASDYAKDATQYIQGCNWKMLAPEVVVLNDYTGVNKRTVKFSRRNIFQRDNNTCQYCRKAFRTRDLTLDHVMPKSRGGRSTWENMVLACYKCNRRKDDKTPKQAGMVLARKPKQPRWEDVKIKGLAGPMPSSWQNFLDEMYWNVELKD